MTQLSDRRDSMSESDLTDLEGDLDKVGFFQNLFFLNIFVSILTLLQFQSLDSKWANPVKIFFFVSVVTL